MSARRLIALTGAVGLAGALVLLVEAPPRRTAEESVSGPRLVRMPADLIARVEVTIGERRAVADRVAERWMVDDAPASGPLAAALTDLVQTLTTLRAVDRFRPRDGASFGFDPPRATIEVTAAQRHTRVVLGELNAARSAVYARREGAPQVWLVGLYLVSALERVVYFASLEPSPTEAPAPASAR
jgi:hypothetical protein